MSNRPLTLLSHWTLVCLGRWKRLASISFALRTWEKSSLVFWYLVILMIWSPNLCELICFSSLSLPPSPENSSISLSLAFWNVKALARLGCLISQCACRLSFSSVNYSQGFLDVSPENLGVVFSAHSFALWLVCRPTVDMFTLAIAWFISKHSFFFKIALLLLQMHSPSSLFPRAGYSVRGVCTSFLLWFPQLFIDSWLSAYIYRGGSNRYGLAD